MCLVTWDVEYTDEFHAWWTDLSEGQRESMFAAVRLLEQQGPSLPFPRSSGVVTSRHANMRELRVPHRGRPLRTFYAFDPRRCAILLIGGDKTGDDRFYERMVPIADSLYDEHLSAIRREGTS